LKKGNSQFLRVGLLDSATTNGGITWVNFDAGVVANTSNAGTGTGTSAVIYNFGGGLFWLNLTTTLPSITARMTMVPMTTSGGSTRVSGGTWYGWGLQIEQVTIFDSSFIPTVASAVTRAADICTCTNLAAFGYNQTEGTFDIEFEVDGSVTGVEQNVVMLSDGTASNYLRIRKTTAGGIFMESVAGGVTQASLNTGATLTAGVKYRAKFVCKGGAYKGRLIQDGVEGSLLTATGASVPTVDRLGLGASATGGTGHLFGTISRLIYYPSEVTI
jgi:hypothetical protein